VLGGKFLCLRAHACAGGSTATAQVLSSSAWSRTAARLPRMSAPMRSAINPVRKGIRRNKELLTLSRRAYWEPRLRQHLHRVEEAAAAVVKRLDPPCAGEAAQVARLDQREADVAEAPRRTRRARHDPLRAAITHLSA